LKKIFPLKKFCVKKISQKTIANFFPKKKFFGKNMRKLISRKQIHSLMEIFFQGNKFAKNLFSEKVFG